MIFRSVFAEAAGVFAEAGVVTAPTVRSYKLVFAGVGNVPAPTNRFLRTD
jgi:hypothetical protein